MRPAVAALPSGALVVALLAVAPSSGNAEERHPMTMERAVELALERRLELREMEAELELARGGLVGAQLSSRRNPEISGGAAARISGDDLSVDAEAGISQTFELGGARRQRVAAAEAWESALLRRQEHLRLEVAAEARGAFVEAVDAGRITDLARQAETLTADLHRIARERLEADAGTELEVNLAALEWLGAQRQLRAAIRRERTSRLALCRALSLSPGVDLALPRELPEPPEVAASEGELIGRALANRPDLAAFDHVREQAEAEIGVARADAWPELTVEATYALEGGSDHIIGAGLSIPLPLFQRNQGEIAQARARAEVARVEVEAARLTIEAEVASEVQRYLAAREVAQLMSGETIGLISRNLELLRLSFEEGNVGLIEVLLVQRDLLAAQREAVEAETELHRARIALELAVGEVIE